MLDYNGVGFRWLGHDGFKITTGGKIIYIDPYQLSKRNTNDADLVLISHNHFDHLSVEDLKQVVTEKTSVVAAKECVEQLNSMEVAEVKGVMPGDQLTVHGIPIEVIPAYNINKKFHPKQDNKVGFVFTVQNMRIYHTGDTDVIPEMSLASPDVALVPVSGTYVMTAEEAAQAVNEKIKPKKLAIPMHYGSIVGSAQDARKFKELTKKCAVEILTKE